MSTLIDNIVEENDSMSSRRVNYRGRYIAKPLGKEPFIQRVKDAILVLKGKAKAYHYMEDTVVELKKIIKLTEESQ